MSQIFIIQKKVLVILLSITLFFPFMPFDVPGRHEIFPLSVVFLLFFPSTKKYLLPLGFLLVFFVGLAFLLSLNLKTSFEFIQIVIVLSSLFLVSKISIGDLKKIENNIFRYSVVLVFFMVLQKLFPEHLQSITNIFSQRVMLVEDFRS